MRLKTVNILLSLVAILELRPVSAQTAYLLNSAKQQLIQTNLATGQRRPDGLNLAIGTAFHNVAETKNGLLVIASGQSVTLVDPQTWQIQATLALPKPAAQMATASAEVPTLEAGSTLTGAKLFGLGYTENRDLAYVGVTTLAGESFIYQIDPSARTVSFLTTLAEIHQPQDLVVSGDGLRIYVSAVRYVPEPAAQVWTINPLNGTLGQPLSILYDPLRPQLSLSRDGNRLYVISADDNVLTINTRTNKLVERFAVSDTQITRLRGAADNRHLWVSTPERMLYWDPLGEEEPIIYKGHALDLATTSDQVIFLGTDNQDAFLQTQSYPGATADPPVAKPKKDQPLEAGIRRMIVTQQESAPLLSHSGLKRIAVLGFETLNPQPGTSLPDIADVVSGDLLWTRQYEIIPPFQVRSILAALDMSAEQVRTSKEAAREVAQGLAADILIVGDPIKIEASDRVVSSLLTFLGSAFLGGVPLVLLGQPNTPRVLAKAQALNPAAEVIWQADTVNFDPGFLRLNSVIESTNNAMVIAAHDISNKFSKGIYEQVKKGMLTQDPPPLVQQPKVLAAIRTIAIFGPDAEIGGEDPHQPPESLGSLFAAQLRKELHWQTLNPDQTRARLNKLGIEPVQVLSTNPRLLAKLLGVDAICLGMVRGSTFYTGSLFNLGMGNISDVVIQYNIVTAKGELAWQDIQVSNVPGLVEDERTTAARRAILFMTKKIKEATPPWVAEPLPTPKTPAS